MDPSIPVARRYRLLRQIGSGGMGAIYCAYDRLTGNQVALKRVVLKDGSGLDDEHAGICRLVITREFQALSTLRHPNIIGVLDYGFQEMGNPFFTMELIKNGKDLLEAGKGKPFLTKIRYIAEVLLALAYIHRRGIVHRDLKPGNILVQKGRVKVLDFGLADSIEAAIGIVGTIHYMAPETLLNHRSIPASDLYSLGILSYELLSGNPFFLQEERVRQSFQKIVALEPDLDRLDVNQKTKDVLSRMLCKKPENRFQDATEVIRALSEAVGEQLPAETEATRDSFLQSSKLIGRDSEMAILSDALRKAIQGYGGTWLISGESGVGKSRIVEQLRTLALVQGALVLRGYGMQNGGGPYDVWTEIFRWLAILLDPNDSELGILKSYVHDLQKLVGRDVPYSGSLEPQLARARLYSTVARSLVGLNQPVVIILEDLQWAGRDSLELFSWLNQFCTNFPVLMIGTYRDEVKTSQLASLTQDMNHLKLGRLTDKHIREFGEAMLGQAPPAVWSFLNRETEGNAFFLVEVLRGLAEEAGELSKISRMTLPGSVLTRGLKHLIKRRLDSVPEDGKDLLYFAAISGRYLEPELLSTLRAIYFPWETGEKTDPSIDLEKWLTQCDRCGVLEFHEERWRFVHDKYREALLAQLTPEQQSRLHLEVARAMEQVFGIPKPLTLDFSHHWKLSAIPQTGYVSSLAFHWSMAGDPEKEGYYCAIAGQAAAARFASEEAIRYLRRALELIRDPKQQVDLMLVLARTLENAGNWYESTRTYQRCLQLSKRHHHLVGEAEAKLELGVIRYLNGSFHDALSYLESAVACWRKLKDHRGTSIGYGYIGTIYLEQGRISRARRMFERQKAHAIQSRDPYVKSKAFVNLALLESCYGNYKIALRLVSRARQMSGIDDAIRNIFSGTLGNLQFHLRNYAEAFKHFQEYLEFCLYMGDPQRTREGYGNLAKLCHTLGFFHQAMNFHQWELHFALELKRPKEIAVAFANLAEMYFLSGNLPDAERSLEYAIRIMRKIGIRRLLVDSLYDLAQIYYEQKQLEKAHVVNREALKISRKIHYKEGQSRAVFLDVLLAVHKGRKADQSGVVRINRRLKNCKKEVERAELLYTLWRLNHSAETAKKASALYKELFHRAPNHEYKKRYQEMALEELTCSFSLPQLSVPVPPKFDSECMGSFIDKLHEGYNMTLK